MNIRAYLRQCAAARPRVALPLLSFPAAQKLGVSVRELVESSDLQAKAMCLVARETPTAAAVSLMDLSVEAQAFGARTLFSDDEVPTITGQLVTDSDSANALRVPRVGEGRTGLCIDAIRKARALLPDRAILAGVIGPYSLAGRLMDVTEIMYLCYDEPETVHAVLEKATGFLTEYCLALRGAGADGVVLAEPLAGLLSPEMCAAFSCPYVQRIIDAVQTDAFAVVYHNCGGAVEKMLPELFGLGAAAYHFGNAVDLGRILDAAPQDALCMGNIDPSGRFAAGTPEEMTQAVRALLDRCGEDRRFLPSSGCDVPPRSKWENIAAFFAAVGAWGQESRR